MVAELWIVPPTSLLTEPVFTPLLKRRCEMSFDFEGDDDGKPKKIRLLFEGVEAYKCTYLFSCAPEMFELAYGKLLDLGATPWLAELSKRYQSYCESIRSVPHRLKHLMICFDDGPCYEIVCKGFSSD
jgi:hypothetical protein